MVNLILKGVRQNNLKDIDLELPLGRSIVITGPSGSGKSSLAFETVHAEGQRRYMQSLSTYARQFLDKFRAPDVDQIQNIPPTIALEQLNPVRNSRATVGTSTEIYDYFRLLFEKIGIEYCEQCSVPMERLSVLEITHSILKKFQDRTVLISFKKMLPESTEAGKENLREYLRAGYSRLLFEGQVAGIEEFLEKNDAARKTIHIIVDRIRLPSENSADSPRNRLSEALRNAMELGLGEADVHVENEKTFVLGDNFSTKNRCKQCHATSQPFAATSFSFNSPLGACQTCKGFGNTLEVDEELVVPNPQLSLKRGAIDPFMKPSLRSWHKKLLSFCASARIDQDLPYKDLPAEQRKLIFEGSKKFRGVRGVFKLLEEEKYKLRIRVFISRYTSPFTCRTCQGTRLNANALRVKLGNKNIAELCALTFEKCSEYLSSLSLSSRQKTIADDLLKQIHRRLEYLITVGLGYLTSNRLSKSLSGGEYQRILLATQLSQGLVDTMYVLDEPSIGLHPKDTHQLLKVLTRLREQGNTLLLVEHDPEVIEWAEHIIDMGPGSGRRGGEVLYAGSKERFFLSEGATSQAVKYWKEECRKSLLKPAMPPPENWLEIKGASSHNLKSIDVAIPLNRLTVITGVSGSGKSTFIVDTVYQALAKIFHGRSERIGRFESISGFEYLSSVELVDQSPIGKSSRSNPITFVKGYDEVRALFAATKEARAKSLTPGHFSFNVSGGRCETCEGEGRVKVDMVFMEDLWVPCQTCDEKRFKPTVLAVTYRGKNIDAVLKMTIDEAYDFFEGSPAIRAKLSLLREVGLGYLQLGQPSYSLSGGEAQRMKIARELVAGGMRKAATLFVLDEPTTGLHFNEITRLISVLRRLIASGHSVVVIEHNLQMICAADYLVDLGPDGGEHGGRVVALGTPREIAQRKLPHTGLYLSEIMGESA